MRHAVVTSFGPQGFESYGRRFVEGFVRYWPARVRLIVYYERTRPRLPADPRIQAVDLFSVAACAAFLARHREDEIAKGRRPAPHVHWRPAWSEAGYSFRHDAYKFCRKVFALTDAALGRVTAGRLFWLDADVVTFAPVPLMLLDAVLPAGVYTCYLGRRGMHSETGFIGFRVGHRWHRRFMHRLAGFYASDEVFRLPEWHDAYVYDRVRGELGLPALDLTPPEVSARHPFVNSVLGRYMDHLKGSARKQAGRSEPGARERPLPAVSWGKAG